MNILPCLPLIQERFWNAIKDELLKEMKDKRFRPEFDFSMFSQTWGDTSLGFGGMGGQAITTAYTVVAIENYSNYAGVFFGERLAYVIKDPNQKFYEDLYNRNMKEVTEKSEYERPKE